MFAKHARTHAHTCIYSCNRDIYIYIYRLI